MNPDPTTITKSANDSSVRALGGLVTIAGFILAWIVWTEAGEVAGHTVSMALPFTNVKFSVAFLLPVLSEGFVLMAVRIANGRATSEKTRKYARRSMTGAIIVMAAVGLIVNTPMAEMWIFQSILASIIGAGTPVALYLGWTLRSRYAEDVARYEERQAERHAKRQSATGGATTTATSKPRSATPKSNSATETATTATGSTPGTATTEPESLAETTAPLDRADHETPEQPLAESAPADVEATVSAVERYLSEVAEADGKKAKAADYVRYLVVAQGRDLHGIKGAEIATGADVSPALGRQVRSAFSAGDLTITDSDKARFAGFGNLSPNDSTTAASTTTN